MAKQTKKNTEASDDQEKFPGYPHYPEKEDIYSKEKEESLEEDASISKEKKKSQHKLGEGLDVPGSELDDQDESIGEEDEENNYYSLGGDNHNDLEEDIGE
jgi:hypothetical protein